MHRKLSARVLKEVADLQAQGALVSSRTKRELAEMYAELSALAKAHAKRVIEIDENWLALSKQVGKVVSDAAESVGVEDATPEELDEIYALAPEAEGLGIQLMGEYIDVLESAMKDLKDVQKNAEIAQNQLEVLDDFPTEIEVEE